MKVLILSLAFSLLSYRSIAQQSSLGQSKSYILSQHKSCFIHINDPTLLLLECDSSLSEYLFEGPDHLCSLIGFEISKEYVDSFKFKLLKLDYKPMGQIVAIPLIVLKDKGASYSTGEMFQNGKYMYTILQKSLDGSKPDYCGVLKENL